MQNTATILVLMGGPDAEREVSIMSGREVAAALRKSARFRVVDRVIDQPSLDELAVIAAESQCDVVFPVLHGHWGEGGPLQQLLDELRLPYVGSGAEAAARAMDKLFTKSLLKAAGEMQSPRSFEIGPDDECRLEPPVVLKPVDDGSSVDLRICKTRDAIAAARCELHPQRPRLMVEQYVRGREITAGIVNCKVLPLIEIIPAVTFYDYEAKYTREDTKYIIDPPLPAAVANAMRRTALLAFETLGCRDVARVDYIVNEHGPWFLEINTMPGFTTHSLVPMAARATGVDMPTLCAELVDAALTRDRAKPQAAEITS